MTTQPTQEAPSSDVVQRALAIFNGGVVRKPSDQNERGYIDYYLPHEAMAAALASTAGDTLKAENGETIESIIQWGDETFGPCTQERAIERAWEEWQEMLERGADVPIEAADVMICLLRIPGIADAIQRKMAINRKRQWNVRDDGTGYHIKGGDQ